ncbi:hypothetical protein [Clostridium sp. Cult2]|uniref:hypothetical protein n=1 Tax=Clostridium sp. Cult2 TaxID=2079003 RepID=UPI001F1C942F|nr:hypothetical protein [Clostridium sp. Cult2]MCF6465073.1 hypothetical protein [Clostridium sp. Cult2]
MDIEKIISEELIAFLPVYLAMKGNCTLILTGGGGKYEIEKTVRTVLNQISKFYLIDLNATKKYYGDLLNIRNLTPIPFNRDNIFVPIKVRKPLLKNDGSFGYVNISYIKKTFSAKGKTIIQLNEGNNIESLSSVDTVNKHIKNGYIVKKLYREKENTINVNEKNLYLEYDKPATKRDIALLINEILKIKENIR